MTVHQLKESLELTVLVEQTTDKKISRMLYWMDLSQLGHEPSTGLEMFGPSRLWEISMQLPVAALS